MRREVWSLEGGGLEVPCQSDQPRQIVMPGMHDVLPPRAIPAFWALGGRYNGKVDGRQDKLRN